MHYVYVIRNELNELYTGSTNDLRVRFAAHNNGKVFSTRGHKWELIYYEAYRVEADAREREKQLKYHGWALAKLKLRLRQSLTQH